MEEIPKIKIVYGEEEFELTEQELDRVIAIASKRLRDGIISMKLGFNPVKKNELRNENDVRVIKGGYESERYRAVSETLAYAIEADMLGNYCTKFLPFAEIQEDINPKNELDSKINRPKTSLPLDYDKYLHNKFHEKSFLKQATKTANFYFS